MALRQILEYPDPRLRTRAEPVTAFDAELGQLVDDLFETMYAAPGIGLAASQVNVHRQVIVIDLSKDGNQPQVYINPRILTRDGVGVMEEGCLSVPNIFDEVERAERVRVRAQDREGRVFECELSPLGRLFLAQEHGEGEVFDGAFNLFTYDCVVPFRQAEVLK